MQTFVSEFYLKLSQYLWKVGGLCLEAAVGNISVLDTLNAGFLSVCTVLSVM